MIMLITKYNLSHKWVQLSIFVIFYFILIKLHCFDLNPNIIECMKEKKDSLGEPLLQQITLDQAWGGLPQNNTPATTEVQASLDQDSPRSRATSDTKMEEMLTDERIETQQPATGRKLGRLAVTDEAAFVDVKSARTVNQYSDYLENKHITTRKIIRELYTGFDYSGLSKEQKREIFQKATILQAHNWEHKLLTDENQMLKAEPKYCGISANTICAATATVVGSGVGGAIVALGTTCTIN